MEPIWMENLLNFLNKTPFDSGNFLDAFYCKVLLPLRQASSLLRFLSSQTMAGFADLLESG